jgi:hypothetical protein
MLTLQQVHNILTNWNLLFLYAYDVTLSTKFTFPKAIVDAHLQLAPLLTQLFDQYREFIQNSFTSLAYIRITT